jgi:hypothetical protein
MKVSMLRAGSKGLAGTYMNVEHHAKRAGPYVDGVAALIEANKDRIYEWRQGHNIHVIVGKNGRQLALRPYAPIPEAGVIGIEASIRISRSQEIPVMAISSPSSLAAFTMFFDYYLEEYTNYYGAESKEV